jgi:hypothetical protein
MGKLRGHAGCGPTIPGLLQRVRVLIAVAATCDIPEIIPAATVGVALGLQL